MALRSRDRNPMRVSAIGVLFLAGCFWVCDVSSSAVVNFKFVSADIYYRSWGTLSRFKDHADDVRSHYDAHYRILDYEAETLWNKIERLKEDINTDGSPYSPGNIFIVIDFHSRRGAIKTYRIDTWRIFFPDDRPPRKIQCEFILGFLPVVGLSADERETYYKRFCELNFAR